MNHTVDAEAQQNVQPSTSVLSLRTWHRYLQQREQLTPFLLFVTGFRPLAFLLKQGLHFVQPVLALLNLSIPTASHTLHRTQLLAPKTEE